MGLAGQEALHAASAARPDAARSDSATRPPLLSKAQHRERAPGDASNRPASCRPTGGNPKTRAGLTQAGEPPQSHRSTRAQPQDALQPSHAAVHQRCQHERRSRPRCLGHLAACPDKAHHP